MIRRAPSNYERQCQWDIEEYFRTLKTAGFQLEDSELSDPEAFMNFATMAAIAAVTVTQLLRARDNPGGQSLLDAFDAEDEQVIEAICADYEGPKSQLTPDQPAPQRDVGPRHLGAGAAGRLDRLLRKAGTPHPQSRIRTLQGHQIWRATECSRCVNPIAAKAGIQGPCRVRPSLDARFCGA